MVRVPFRCLSSAIAGWLVNNLCFSEQRAVPESNFDVIVKALSSENAATTQVSELDWSKRDHKIFSWLASLSVCQEPSIFIFLAQIFKVKVLHQLSFTELWL